MRITRSIQAALGTAASVSLLLLWAGCSAMSASPEAAGVTPGGSQDIGFAREIIGEGGIPAAEHFAAEGLFSEHDLPLTGPDCQEVLCPRAAAAWIDPIGNHGSEMLVQLGFATNIDMATFERRPLNLAVAVDVSGSMDYDDKMPAVREALKTLVDQLDENDQMALVAFDNNAVLRKGMTTMNASGREAMHDAIDKLQPQGGTNIEAGLDKAFKQVAPQAGADGVEDRVMLFTDAQPNVGATDLDSFLGMTRYYGAAGIGTSVFGVGLDLGSELAEEISEVRGGNYFYLADSAAIEKVFDEEFDYMVTPVAYDLEVTVETEASLEFGEAYGAPLDAPGQDLAFGASTLFLSKRRGGIGVTLRPLGGGTIDPEGPLGLATFDMSYLPIDAGQPVTGQLAVDWQGGSEIEGEFTFADDLGVYKMGVLLDEYLALMAGATYCTGVLTEEEAVDEINEAIARLDAVATHLGDAPLEAEVDLMEALRTNVQGGTGNCWTADPYYY